MADYEYQADTAAGLVRIRKMPDGLWCVYLDDREWLRDFRLPENALDSVTMIEHPFPEGVRFVGNSMTLDLSDRLSDWRKKRIK
jgi:hypothetical protein